MEQNPSVLNRNLPTRGEAMMFRGKAVLLQIKRATQNLSDRRIRKYSVGDRLINETIIAESKTSLWTESDRAEEAPLLAGKVHNLRLAIQRLNGVEVGAGEVFSFWAQIGRANRARGFVAGRELREGCIVPSVGGGLCQLSNALYDAALRADFKIIERHAHTQIIPGSLAEKGRDATVFWNYVDLRFKSDRAFRIEASLNQHDLIVRFKSEKSKIPSTKVSIQISNSKTQIPNSCATCGVGDCFRNSKSEPSLNFGRAAFLVDEFSPEFDSYLQQNRSARDLLLLPLDGKRFRKANYAWTTAGFAKKEQSFLTTMLRSYKSRKLAAQGASRQRNLLAMSEKLAKSFAERLTFDVLHVVVQQNLLPFLWRDGHLGGRTFDVLMTALPMQNLQERLDFAARLHPESRTLGDFRAPTWLVVAETEALRAARRIITPHREIARLFPEKTELLNWKMPSAKSNFAAKPTNEKPTIVFPAATVGRKGAYELREAARGLNVKIVLLGAQIESAEFWNGFDVEHRTGAQNWLETADLVVLPAFVEHKPRRLLQAAACGVPVIASQVCGVENVAGIETIDCGDAVSLREKIVEMLFKQTAPRSAKHETGKTIAAL